MRTIDVDEAAELTIWCKANRTFDMAVNLNRSTSGKSYKLQVKSNDTLLLSFASGSGLSLQPTAVQLYKSPSEMDLPTGCYGYDLVEISGANAENIFFGWFIIQPAYTTLP